MEKNLKIGQKVYISHLNERTLETYISEHNIIGFYSRKNIRLDPSFNDVSQYAEKFNPNYLFTNIEDSREKCIELLKNKKTELMEQVYRIEENIDASYELEALPNKKKNIKCNLKRRATSMKNISKTFPEKYSIGKPLYATVLKPGIFNNEANSVYVREFIVSGMSIDSDREGVPSYSIELENIEDGGGYIALYLDDEFKMKKDRMGNIIDFYENKEHAMFIAEDISDSFKKEFEVVEEARLNFKKGRI